jgi:hypothetical protein
MCLDLQYRFLRLAEPRRMRLGMETRCLRWSLGIQRHRSKMHIASYLVHLVSFDARPDICGSRR